MVRIAEVKIWNQLVGALAWDDANALGAFEFDSGFKSKGIDLAPLMMPVASSQKIFSFPELRNQSDPSLDTFRGLPGLLADALPDRYGNDLINAWLSSQGRPANSMNPVELLCFIGTRGMGALEFEPQVFNSQKNTFSIEIDSLVGMAQTVLSKRKKFNQNLSNDQEHSMREILRIGTSAGGARPKAVIAYNEKTGEVRSGQTNAPKGFEHWLIKLDGVSDTQFGKSKGYGKVEMAYYLMAKDCGIDMMPSMLFEENGRAHFMTKRFDREGSDTKHHIQTFCAIKHYDYNQVTSYSYEQLLQTMRELKLPYDQAVQMFRRMVFNVAAKNCDDHTKNFAFMMKQGEAWSLAPAYDICHAYKPDHRWVSQHALSINGNRKAITKADLLQVAANIKTGREDWNGIIDKITSVVRNWKNYADQVRVNPALRDEIDNTLKTQLRLLRA